MRNDIDSFYVVISDNKVICYGFNLSELHREFVNKYNSNTRYEHFYRKLKKQNPYPYHNKVDNKIYIFQRVIGQ